MNCTTERVVAADYMQRDVVTTSSDNTLREALSLMTENHVTGLPVMDEFGRCIGLITASDILNYEQEHAEESSDDGTTEFFDPKTQRWSTVPHSVFGLEQFGDVKVSDVMTRDLVWVDRYTLLKTAAQRMIDEQVHRVLVMDVASQLYGVLSAYDFVRFAAED